MFLGMQDLIFP